jgi:hypothetical protein
MCSYDTTQIALLGSAKRESGWTGIASANIYHACPYHSALDDALNIDIIVKGKDHERIALELSVESALALAHSILATLEHEGHAHSH